MYSQPFSAWNPGVTWRWTVLLTVVQIYAANASQYALFGVLSGIILILTSLYLASVILMIGVVVNTVTADTDDVTGSSQL